MAEGAVVGLLYRGDCAVAHMQGSWVC